MEFRHGSLLDAEGLIVHQCNCVSSDAKGLAKEIFNKYPSSNCYTTSDIRIPGRILVKGNVVNLFGQNTPGKPKTYETKIHREEWFQKGLDELRIYMTFHQINEVSFPFLIGCGMAGGEWKNYYQMLKNFQEKTGFNVVICKLDE
jgi:hypothetical protein